MAKMNSAVPRVLGIETATRGGSVCLSIDAQTISRVISESQTSHSNTLLRQIGRVLEQAQIDLVDVDLFAVASGPGSFTGLRIGLATVKALATTLQRPCVGVPTLKAIAHAAGPAEVIVTLLPAGRGELFVQRFSVTSDLVITESDRPAHTPLARVMERYGNLPRILWSGEGAHLHIATIREWARRAGATFFDSEVQPQSTLVGPLWSLAPLKLELARDVAAVALAEFRLGKVLDSESLRALYVRPSDAELKFQCQ